jgi:hypothetical protein
LFYFDDIKQQKNKTMTILEAIEKIKKVNGSSSCLDWSEQTRQYQFDYNGKSLRINRERLDSGEWLVMVNSECVGVVKTLKAAKEVGAYYLTK